MPSQLLESIERATGRYGLPGDYGIQRETAFPDFKITKTAYHTNATRNPNNSPWLESDKLKGIERRPIVPRRQEEISFTVRRRS